MMIKWGKLVVNQLQNGVNLQLAAKAPENWPKLPQKEMKLLHDFLGVLLLVLQRVSMMAGFSSAEFLFINGDPPHDKNSITNNFARNF